MTKYIKSDLETGRLIDLQSDDDRDWFKDHPEHFIRIRFPTDGDHAALRAIGASADRLNGTIVVELHKELLYAPSWIIPFSRMWCALHGESYKDEEFFYDVKKIFQLCHGKRVGSELFRKFKRRCPKARRPQ